MGFCLSFLVCRIMFPQCLTTLVLMWWWMAAQWTLAYGILPVSSFTRFWFGIEMFVDWSVCSVPFVLGWAYMYVFYGAGLDKKKNYINIFLYIYYLFLLFLNSKMSFWMDLIRLSSSLDFFKIKHDIARSMKISCLVLVQIIIECSNFWLIS